MNLYECGIGTFKVKYYKKYFYDITDTAEFYDNEWNIIEFSNPISRVLIDCKRWEKLK